MALPAGFERKDEKKSEEVHIPAQAKPDENITGKKLIPIDTLDEVCLMFNV